MALNDFTGFYPPNPLAGGPAQTAITDQTARGAVAVLFERTAVQAAAASPTAVHAAVTDTGAEQSITSGFTAPPCPRNITATSGGTGADIGAIVVTVFGTNAAGEAISEALPIFTANSATTVTGNKAFATVTSWTLPAHDGTGATTSLGFGDKLGLEHLYSRNTLLHTHLANAKEGTAATIAFSATHLESNTLDPNSSLNGTALVAYFLLP